MTGTWRHDAAPAGCGARVRDGLWTDDRVDVVLGTAVISGAAT